jgi:coenzyme Q-binding protein COQ10
VIQEDGCTVHAPLARVFACAADVGRWPEWLPHYRWVRFLEHSADGGGVVEMAAWRPFGPLRYPTRWVSEMRVDRETPAVRYRHVGGITRGMDVEWRFEGAGDGGPVRVRVVHRWAGPPWPLVGGVFASWLVGPVFVHGIARLTLAGIARAATGPVAA